MKRRGEKGRYRQPFESLGKEERLKRGGRSSTVSYLRTYCPEASDLAGDEGRGKTLGVENLSKRGVEKKTKKKKCETKTIQTYDDKLKRPAFVKNKGLEKRNRTTSENLGGEGKSGGSYSKRSGFEAMKCLRPSPDNAHS